MIGLRPGKRRLLLRAWVLTGLVRVGLWTIGFRRLSPMLSRRFGRRRPPVAGAPSAMEIARAVERAARRFPGARNCLVMALTARALLARAGHDSEMRLGAFRDEGGELRAHAWVEANGEVVIGGNDLEKYKRFTRLEEAGR